MLYEDPTKAAEKPTVHCVLGFTIDKKTHITETTTFGYFSDYDEAKAKFEKVADYAAVNDASAKRELLLDTNTEFAYLDEEGNECHILIHHAG